MINMVRDCKFRAKSADNQNWVFGFYTEEGDAGYIIDPKKYWMKTRVLKTTRGQYIGVDDKNGVEIYEGDIIDGAIWWLERMKPAIVMFRDGSFGLFWWRGSVGEFTPFTSMVKVEYEVVGNIYDNQN